MTDDIEQFTSSSSDSEIEIRKHKSTNQGLWRTVSSHRLKQVYCRTSFVSILVRRRPPKGYVVKCGLLYHLANLVMHSCVRHRWCYNPAHLEQGTIAENQAHLYVQCPSCKHSFSYNKKSQQ